MSLQHQAPHQREGGFCALAARSSGKLINADIGWFVGLQRPAGTDPAFELSLCEAGHASIPQPLRRPTDGLVLALQVPDAAQVERRLAQAGVPLLSSMTDEPWGQRHFFAQAPDGVALDIFQLIAPDPTWMREHGFA